MVWGVIAERGRTPLVIVAGNLTGIRYRDEIAQRYVIPGGMLGIGHHCCLGGNGIQM
jgi:hypothetical protein